jgi:uncharacterized membrane protein YcfT
MPPDIDSQYYLITKQFEHDREMRVIERLNDIKAQGAKGLAVINAGAVVAMFAFVQALASRPEFFCFKEYAIISISLFLMGAFLSSIVFAFQYKAIGQAFDIMQKGNWQTLTWFVIWISASFAFIGGVVAIWGIAEAL